MASSSPEKAVRLGEDAAATATQQDWERAVAAVLRKTGRLGPDDPDSAVWAALTTETVDGVPVLPLGTPDTAAGVPDAGLPGQAPFTRGARAARDFGGWDVRSLLTEADPKRSAAIALEELENGVTSLWLAIGAAGLAPDNLATALEPVLLDLAPVVLDATLDAPDDPAEAMSAQLDAAQALARVASARGVQLEPRGNLGGNPFRAGLGPDHTDRLVGELAEIGSTLGIRCVVADGTDVHDRGAGDVTELAYALAAGASYLRLLTATGMSPERAAASIEFRYAASADQFVTIAKLRAARLLWARVLELSGLRDEGRGQAQHAVTSRPMMTRYDPWVNMLRTTIATFAAGVGGAEAVTTLPFDEAVGEPVGLSRRNARNTSALLMLEAHLGRVTDPAGGSHAVERLTADLAGAAWQQFDAIEAAGGLAAALRAGVLDDYIAKSREVRDQQIATRRRPITGVSEFPHHHERLLERVPHRRASQVHRYAAPYEQLRDNPVAQPVYLATLGTVAQHTARATFAANLLAAGGIGTTGPGATSGPDAVLAGYAGEPVIFLAGPEALYEQWGPHVVAGLRERGASWVIVAGPPLDALAADDHATADIDALVFLHRTRDRLQGEP